MTDASTASSTKLPTICFFFLLFLSRLGVYKAARVILYSEGICWLVYTLIRSLARMQALLVLMDSPFPPLSLSLSPYCAAHLFLFFSQPISVRCCCRRSFSNARLDYRGVCRNKQTNSERSEKERKKQGFFSTLSRSRAPHLSHFLIFSKYNIRSGHTSFVSHSLAHIFKHRRRRPSSFMPFLLSPFFLFLFAWSSSNNMRFIYYHRSCSWCCYYYSTNNVIYLSL